MPEWNRRENRKKILFNAAKETGPRLSVEIVRNKIDIIVYARTEYSFIYYGS